MIEKFAIITISGGLGKSILSTSVIRAMRNHFDNNNENDRKIIVVSGYDAPFIYNKNIYRTYLYGQTPFFYDEYIKNKDVKIFTLEPYQAESYLLRQKHLTEIWCDLFGIKNNNSYPELILNPRMTELVKDKLKPNNKPLFLLQSNGGSNNQSSKKSWSRDIPIQQAQQIASYYHNKGFRVLHLRHENQLKLENTEWLSLPILELFHVIQFINKSLLIDSFMQHSFAALNKKSTVCWISTSPKVFGYDIHDNILPKSKEIFNYEAASFLEQYDFTGNMPFQFPYEDINIFDINEIITSIEKQ